LCLSRLCDHCWVFIASSFPKIFPNLLKPAVIFRRPCKCVWPHTYTFASQLCSTLCYFFYLLYNFCLPSYNVRVTGKGHFVHCFLPSPVTTILSKTQQTHRCLLSQIIKFLTTFSQTDSPAPLLSTCSVFCLIQNLTDESKSSF
jgi:hypothetical protein